MFIPRCQCLINDHRCGRIFRRFWPNKQTARRRGGIFEVNAAFVRPFRTLQFCGRGIGGTAVNSLLVCHDFQLQTWKLGQIIELSTNSRIYAGHLRFSLFVSPNSTTDSPNASREPEFAFFPRYSVFLCKSCV